MAKRKIQFKRGVESPTVEVADGSYVRIFNREEQPFDVTDDEWKVLARTELFEPAMAAKKALPTVKQKTPGQPEQK